MLAGFCPAQTMEHLNPETGGTAAMWWLPRLGAMMLFIFLQVSTPIGDAYDACASDTMPEVFATLAHSYMTEDLVFYRVSFTINLFVYGMIMITTYLLFITGPTADNLLLNSIALQFLVEVDNICYMVLMSESTKNELVQKMKLCYIQNGEKPTSEIEKSHSGEQVKNIISVVVGTYLGYIAAFMYWLAFIMPVFVYFCII